MLFVAFPLLYSNHHRFQIRLDELLNSDDAPALSVRD